MLNGEQKFSSEEAKGCEKISEREGEGTNPALTGNVPSSEAAKGTLGATLPAGIGPLAPAVCWIKRNFKKCSHTGGKKKLSRTQSVTVFLLVKFLLSFGKPTAKQQ